MFCWYQRSKVCYAYLADVPDLTLDGLSDGLSFTSSRWFTRGWTLQELIAPQNLVFFSHNWHDIGTKKSLSSELSRITRVEQKFLTSRDLFWHLRDDSPSIAQIMSWAAERRTTRVEDRAYCLLGLFDITMPLWYGEGRKAFFRLQEELIKVSNDQSLFAWGISPGQQLRLTDFDDRHLLEAMIEHDWKLGTTGMFAQSPADFRNSGNICRLPFPVQFFPYCKAPAAIINRGFRLEMPLFNYWGPIDKSVLDSHFLQRAPPGGQLFVDIPTIEDLIFAVIACSYEGDTQNYLGIPLLSLGHKLSFREGMMVWGRCRSVILVPGEVLLKKCTLIHIHSHWISDWCLPESVSPLR
jgi:hypothetical protein